MIRDFS